MTEKSSSLNKPLSGKVCCLVFPFTYHIVAAMIAKKHNFDCSHPYTTSITVYDVSPSFAYAVFRIKSSGEIAENYKLWIEMNNNCHFAIGEGKPRVSAYHVNSPFPRNVLHKLP